MCWTGTPLNELHPDLHHALFDVIVKRIEGGKGMNSKMPQQVKMLPTKPNDLTELKPQGSQW